MKTLLLVFLILLFGMPAFADYDKGWTAYLDQDYETALKELYPLAEEGDAPSQYAIGWMYRNGEGVEQDYRVAARWYRLAADQGHADAQRNLGLMHQFGEGVTLDYKAAAKWYRLAAEQGNAEAQGNLGLMYLDGKGVLQDYIRAYIWLDIAASQGVPLAMWSREELKKKITPAQVDEAQELARACMTKKFRDC